ncbi:MAG TPA: hypothetical protein VK594_12810 [Streptosporangiaceae bacterium]|jgi:hypothetical protein|nr:hypothetical protein [Streptosporangiaceae bacterium]
MPGRSADDVHIETYSVHFWPLGTEPRQIDLIASAVLPEVRP